ncbi:MAG: hypothetical protein ACRC5M_06635 [Anaeroplasmataceae bacterium]
MKLINFFKKKKEEKDPNISVRSPGNIYCELHWEKLNNTTNAIKLYGYNQVYNLKILCSNNVFNREIHHSLNPADKIYIPRILFEIDWGFIFRDGLDLKEFKITFSNYNISAKTYSVIMECTNYRNKFIKDYFVSTNRVFVDPFELTDNIDKFFKYSENYK